MDLKERVLVINLEERNDRWKNIYERLKKLSISPNLVKAIRAPGSLGPGLSHLTCIEMAKNKGWDFLVVLEDDAKVEIDTFQRLQEIFPSLPKNWDIIIGGASGLKSCIPIHEEWIKIHFFTGLHFVIYRESSYEMVLNWKKFPRTRGFKGVGSKLPHLDQYLSMISQNNLNIYCPRKFICRTENGYSDVREREVDDTSIFDEAQEIALKC